MFEYRARARRRGANLKSTGLTSATAFVYGTKTENFMTLERFLDEAVDNAKAMWDHMHGEIIPCFFCVDRNDKATWVGTPWQDEDEKKATEITLRGLMKVHNIARYAFICSGRMRPVGDGPVEDIMHVIVADSDRSLGAVILVHDNLRVRKLPIVRGPWAELLWEGRRDH